MLQAIIVFALFGINAAPDLIPEIIPHPNAAVKTPLWVAAERAINAEGVLDERYFELYRLNMLRDAAAQNERLAVQQSGSAQSGEPCVVFVGASPREHFAHDENLDDLVRNAQAIVEGRIVATQQGFYAGKPSSLLLIEPEPQGKAALQRPSPKYLIVFPEATIKTKAGALCAKPVSGPPRPSIGSRLLVFAMEAPVKTTTAFAILSPDVARHVVLESSGSRYVPRAVSISAGEQATFDQIVNDVARRQRDRMEKAQ